MNDTLKGIIAGILVFSVAVVMIKKFKTFKNEYKYEVFYDCDWNGCLSKYVKNYEIKDGCLKIKDLTICQDFRILELK